jgi:hypothetical protein
MSMAIYLSYLLLEVVMLIRITILNYGFKQAEIIHSPCDKTENLVAWYREWLCDQLESEEEVLYRLTSVYSAVIWNDVIQDEDEVDLIKRIRISIQLSIQ